MDKIKVALTSEDNRYNTAFKALDYFSKELNDKIARLDQKEDYILIKPNCVVSTNKNCATYPEAIKAVLDFLAPLWTGRIILAEGSSENTFDAFKNYGYEALKKAYSNLEFLDLNYADAVFIDVFDRELKPMTIKIANTFKEAPLRISVGPPKTHDSVIVTLSIKNCAVGAILKEDKAQIHQGPKAINRTIAEIDQFTRPHFAIIDGWQGMEGEGPASGQMVDTRFCVASMDALAADVLTTKLIGFNPVQIGYLNYLGAKEIQDKIEVVDRNPKDFQFHFKPHPTYLKQIEWT